MDDLELLHEYSTRQSEEAFTALVKRHVDLVYSTSLRLVRDPHLAEEITQAVFLVLARKAARISPRTVLAGWLYRTARLTAGHALRARARRRNYEQQAIELMRLQLDPHETWESIAPLLDEVMGKLTETERNVILLRFFERKLFRKIGDALGISEDAAKKRAARALEKLRTNFARKQLVVPASAIIAALSACAVKAAPVGLTAAIVADAAAKGATRSAFALAKETLQAMGWANGKVAAIGGWALALSLGTALVFRELRQTVPRSPPETGVFGAALAQPQPTSSTVVATFPLDWREIESRDYAAYMANLRRIGCPEEVVAAIITDKINRAYAPHFAPLDRVADYWTYNFSGDPYNIAKSIEREMLLKERHELLTRLGLPEPMPDPASNSQWVWQRRLFGFLGPAKREALIEIEAKYERMSSSNYLSATDLMPRADEEARKSMQHKKREEIMALLTPGELEQYDLRTSQLSHRLRFNLDTFQPAEEEFVKIFRVLGKAEPELGGGFFTLVSGDGAAGTRLNQAQQRLDEELQEALGEERFLEYSKKRDANYRGLEELGQRFALPAEVVDALYVIHTEAIQTRVRYRYDASIPDHLRKSGWLSAQAALAQKVRGYLDEGAFDTYQNSRLGTWVEGSYDRD